jgi:hypothetical protein
MGDFRPYLSEQANPLTAFTHGNRPENLDFRTLARPAL